MKTSQSLHVIGSVHCGTEEVEDSQSQSRFGWVQYYWTLFFCPSADVFKVTFKFSL